MKKLLFLFVAGKAGIICFALTIRLAYASLMKKLQARQIKERKKTVTIHVTPETLPPSPVQKSIAVINSFNSSTDIKSRDRAMTLDTLSREVFTSIDIFQLKKINFFNLRMKNENV